VSGSVHVAFGGIAFAASIPLLLRTYHRFQTRVTSAIALSVLGMAGMFSPSTFVIGPAISGGESGSKQRAIETPTVDRHDR
jgi:hypothetical protein